jgi:two-component system cell cycle sensor histidine kinase/response regulator CckA
MPGVPVLAGVVRLVEVGLQRLPKWLRPYVVALAQLLFVVLAVAMILKIFGLKAAGIGSLILILFVLCAAWHGYGPGLLVCAITFFVVPPLLLPKRPHNVATLRFAILVGILLLVSRVANATRRKTAGLEKRVAERTEDLQRAEQSRAWLASIVESSDDAIIGETLDGTITSWNRGAERLYGYTAAEVIGKSTAFLAPSGSVGEIEDIRRRVREGESIQRLETVGLHKDRSAIAVSLTISPIRDVAGAMQGVSTIARDMMGQRGILQALEQSEQRYRLLFENNPRPMWVYDQETLGFLAVNEAAVKTYGYSREEFLGMTLRDIRPPEDVPKLIEAVLAPTDALTEGPWRHRKKDGSILMVEISEHPLVFGGRDAYFVMPNDVTERLKLEIQFRQAQRLESVGRLAGGIAHDFNNLLTVINGYSEMVLADLPAGASTRDSILQIREAGERAAGLTRQLLAFSRQQVIEPAVLDINAVINDTLKLLRRLIGEDVNLVTRLDPDLGHVVADAGQLQQIIMNLAVNARDAMPGGGTLLIETSNTAFDETYLATHPEVRLGSHVMLAVTDTGVGMTPEVQAKIFEPFFTTKDIGKGTGLGLATVYGMVKQSGGWIWVYSEPGRGTTFKVYLQRTDEPLSRMRTPVPAGLHGNETILVVEDQSDLRALAIAALSRYGYSVHGAGSGNDALAFCRDFQNPIHLVLTDVVMPDMNGRELAGRMAALRPDTHILYMSGYTANVIVHHGVVDDGVAFLQKPFTPESLAAKVREVLSLDGGPHV